MKNLEGKKALVTAASRGIGRAIAERLAADGARVAITYIADVVAFVASEDARWITGQNLRATGGLS